MSISITPIHRPTDAGKEIAQITINGETYYVYWNSVLQIVIYSDLNQWWMSHDGRILHTLGSIIGEPLRIHSFELLEAGVTVTRQEDRDLHAACSWSDYAVDNLFFRASYVTASNGF